VQEVINTTFLSKFASKSVEEDNEDYLESHKDSPAHIQSAVRVRNILNPGSDDTKSKGAKDLESAVALDVASLQEAIDGLHLSDEIGAGSEARESYLEAARKQWPEASVFKSSH
jgi:peptide alpha-N-acetyltransferase